MGICGILRLLRLFLSNRVKLHKHLNSKSFSLLVLGGTKLFRVIVVVVDLLSCVQLFATIWTGWPVRLLCPLGFPGKNSGVGSHFLPLGIFLDQGLNLSLLNWQADSFPMSHQGNPEL